ncbi:MAG: insulinase family protein, partial [Gemmatimonadetes bacterium]|nr:insulinase family protein [Gemmatimonadota bacterium]
MIRTFGALLAAILLAAPAAALEPGAELPVDPDVRLGELDNGLRYLIRENGRPQARAELRLVVAAGSVDEDEDQRGLAHFVEHMVFNGTKSWAGNEIVDYLERIGADFGADLNAYTSFDETVYMLEIPTDEDGLLEDGVRILSEFASAATLTDEEIDKERGVVLDEWRRGLGAGARIRDVQLPIVLKGSRYAERLPIGLPEIIENGEADAIRRYYRDWYRPERMAFIAVGDFDADRVEGWIRDSFGAIRPEGDPRERTDWDIPSHPDTLLALADDPELRSTSVGFTRKRPVEEEQATYDAYREMLVERMAMSMFNSRLGEIAREDDAPFLGAGFGVSSLGRTVELPGVSARVRQGEEVRGLQALVTEARRAERHGFLESEVRRARANLLAGIEATYAEREKTPSGQYVSEYVRHFLNGEPIPGIEVEREIWRRVVPEINGTECHEALVGLLGGDGLVIEATRPSGEDLVGGDALLAAFRDAAAREPEAWIDAGADGDLLAERGTPGTVTERREHPEIGVTEAVLSNGVRVFIKPTDFQADDIRFSGTAFGGLSVVDDDDLVSASAAGSILRLAGWGGHSPVELGKLLAGKVASASPFFGERTHGVSGSSTVADLDTALDLVTLVMTSPNRDEAAFARFLDRLRTQLENRDANPGTRYFDRVVEINTLDDPRSRPLTVDRLDEIDMETAISFYEESFRNAADFAFFFVGNVEVEDVLPRIARTLGALPSDGKPAGEWTDRPVGFPEAPVVETVYAGTEPKGQTTYTLRSYDGQDPREWHRIRT